MQISSPTALLKALRKAFLMYFATEDTKILPLLCHTENSDSDKENYEWLGQAGVMEEFRGQVKFAAMSDTDFEIDNVIYAVGHAVSVDDVRRNKTGSIMMRVKQAAERARSHFVKLLMEDIEANSTCYDGVSMFNNAHPARKNEGGTQDNNLALTGTTVANLQTDISLGVAKLKSFVDEEGEPYHGDPDKMNLMAVTATDIEYNMRTALNATIISQTSNVNIGIADIHVSSRLTDSTFYLFRTDGPKPYILQLEQPVTWEVVESGETAVVRRQHQYVVSASGAVKPGQWQSGIKFA